MALPSTTTTATATTTTTTTTTRRGVFLARHTHVVGASAAATAELRGCLPRWGVWNVSSTPPPFLFCIGPARRRRHTPPSYPDLHRRSISSRSSPLLEGGTLRFVESAAPLLLLLRAEREKQLLSPSPSIQITPPSLSPLLCLSSLSLPFVFSSYFSSSSYLSSSLHNLVSVISTVETKIEPRKSLTSNDRLARRCTLVNWRLRGRYFSAACSRSPEGECLSCEYE